MPETASPFLIFGHRGDPGSHPENTLPSFHSALECGADGFETDLRMLADGTAVLFHDDAAGADPVERLNRHELEGVCGQITLLSQLEPMASRSLMILEVKRHGWERELLAIVRSWPNIVISSFDHRVLRELRALDPTLPRGMILSGYHLSFAQYAQDHGAAWAFPNVHYVDGELVASLVERGIRVVPWTCNDRQQWEWLRTIGCHGVITDFPARAVEWRK